MVVEWLQGTPTPPFTDSERTHYIILYVNWVASPKDRISKDFALESRSNDAAEEQHWKHTVAKPFKIHELYQPPLTHSSAIARSRLDRVYWNQHLVDQLAHRLVCAALEATQLSAHRAISFARRLPQQQDFRPIQPHAVHQIGWKPKVCARFQSLFSHANPSGFRFASFVFAQNCHSTGLRRNCF